jgi:thioredoxin 1
MVHQITSESEFIQLVANSTGYVLVDFFAEWCGPCKRFVPTLEKLAKEYENIKFYKVDVDILEDIAKEEDISAMPTFILYKDGKELEQKTKGYRLQGASEDATRKLLNKAT